MPWTPKQMKAIRARAHGWKPSKGGPFEEVSESKAKEMSEEGLRPPVKKTRKGKQSNLKAQLLALKKK